MKNPVKAAILELLTQRSGRSLEFEEALDEVLDEAPPGCKHAQMMVEAVRWGSRAISAVHSNRGLVRIITPDGLALSFEFEDAGGRASAVTQAVRRALGS